MKHGLLFLTLLALALQWVGGSPAQAREYERERPPRQLTAEQAATAAANYQQYCALCHGDDRQGHVNDHAPSLRSQSLFESGVPHAILRPLSYGREGTPMGGYLDEVGGPLTLDEAWDLTYWLFWESGAERVKLSEDPVPGDITRGAAVYRQHCADCHGVDGEGVTAPALANPSALAHNKDEFIRYAIEKGRQDTPMPAFEGVLAAADIDNVTAYIRSLAKDPAGERPALRALPTPDQYVLNPDQPDPEFELRDGRYVTAPELHAAMVAKKRLVLLDTRVTSVWQRAHIEGAVPFPYYTDLAAKVETLPRDAQIVAYCSCPRAAADYIIDQLAGLGYTRTAVLYEGIFGWMNQGFPVVRAELGGQAAAASPAVLPGLAADLVNHYDFDHPLADDPGQETDLGLSGTSLWLVNGGADMRVDDAAWPGAGRALQTRQVNPESEGNDDWKAGVYAEGGVTTLNAFNAAQAITLMGWVKPTGAHPGMNTTSAEPGDRFGSVGLFGILSGTSEGHLVRALVEIITVNDTLRLVALGRREDEGTSLLLAAPGDWQAYLPRDRWTHVAATFDYDAGEMALFINGEAIDAEYTTAGDPWAVDGPPKPDLSSATDPRGIKIGGSYPQNTLERNPFNGRFDDLMFFNRALTVDEVRAQYRQFVEPAHPTH
ncbi:c-type cytochrome [Marinihelvus fidelis]|uniref:C-type cytochrome n=1 Tax=Marinihelvus fidelis TaxID=2613842 RepID=A0A5N0TI55_9GAMM|nr:c-type cytochrome [Marinihelvus fidelis]KAA9134154.1 c-type cytochrome [Marinihelvus fidelis]